MFLLLPQVTENHKGKTCYFFSLVLSSYFASCRNSNEQPNTAGNDLSTADPM